MRRFWILSLAVIALGVLPHAAHAQVAQAELRGAVLDESGAALPGTTITATHIDTGTVRQMVTSSTGTYVMPALPIGVYKIAAELPGFGGDGTLRAAGAVEWYRSGSCRTEPSTASSASAI